MPLKRQISGILAGSLQARHHCFCRLASKLYVQGVRAKFDVVAPSDGSTLSKSDRFEELAIAPCFEHASPSEVGQVDFAGCAVGIVQPDAVAAA